MMGIDGRVRRMDSMMVGSNMRVLSRSELVFECVARVCRRLRHEPRSCSYAGSTGQAKVSFDASLLEGSWAESGANLQRRCPVGEEGWATRLSDLLDLHMVAPWNNE